MTSGMCYYGTNDEVQLGDRVSLRCWFRNRRGTVCYIPGISKPHREMEYEGIRKWAIRLDNGTVLAIGYAPEDKHGQPARDLRLVARSSGGELTPDEALE